MKTPTLTSQESAILQGESGPAPQRAMQFLINYARIVGAKRFIPITSAHIDGCLYHGPSSLDFVHSFTQLQAQVSVPTTLNVAAVDTLHPELNTGEQRLISEQEKLTQAYTQLGCEPTLTCAPYQRKKRPAFGSHIAWAESNAIVFANSVLGARTERYGDFTDLCAAIAGRVPEVGLHCDKNRWATVLVEAVALANFDGPRDIYFACMGYCLGKLVGNEVAALCGLPPDTNEDELKSLGAAAASAGAVALFHAVGITPEAKTLADAVGGEDNIAQVTHTHNITAEALNQAFTKLCPLEQGEAIAAICLGTPHYSFAEFFHLAQQVRGRQAQVEVYVSASRETVSHIQLQPWYKDLEHFGVQLVVDTCTYVAPVVRQQTGAILTTSAKWAHYGPGNLKCRAGLKTLDDCIRSAEVGYVC